MADQQHLCCLECTQADLAYKRSSSIEYKPRLEGDYSQIWMEALVIMINSITWVYLRSDAAAR